MKKWILNEAQLCVEAKLTYKTYIILNLYIVKFNVTESFFCPHPYKLYFFQKKNFVRKPPIKSIHFYFLFIEIRFTFLYNAHI